MPRCTNCLSEDLEEVEERGELVCTQCGTVLEQSAIVASVEFQEGAGGASKPMGQYVSSTQTRPHTRGTKGVGYSKQSKEIALENGRRMIARLASQMKISQHLVDSAHHVFRRALDKNFVQGRKTVHVIASCLYIVVRRERDPPLSYMLIDFSDAVRTNVFTLGATLTKLMQTFEYHLPTVDPSFYINRFAGKMELGDEKVKQKVIDTASRLVQSMNRDWIRVGRRPAGICGACLLVAARMHGFKRTRRDLLKIVRVTDNTLRNRLAEFELTKASHLSLDDFRGTEVAEEQDPPSFTKGELQDLEFKRKVRRTLKEIADTEPDLLPESMASAIVPVDPVNHKYDSMDPSLKRRYLSGRLGSNVGAYRSAGSGAPREGGVGGSGGGGEGGDVEVAAASSALVPYGDGGSGGTPITKAQRKNAHMYNSLHQEMSDALAELSGAAPKKQDHVQPMMRAAGYADDEVEDPDRVARANKAFDAGADSEGASDSDGDIDNMILTMEESRRRSSLWTRMNQQYLDDQAAKEAMGTMPAPKRKRRKGRDVQVQQPAASAAEATKEMLTKKTKISKKLNYAALDSLDLMFDGTGAPTATTVDAAGAGDDGLPPAKIARKE